MSTATEQWRVVSGVRYRRMTRQQARLLGVPEDSLLTACVERDGDIVGVEPYVWAPLARLTPKQIADLNHRPYRVHRRTRDGSNFAGIDRRTGGRVTLPYNAVLATSVSERWWVLRHPVSATPRATATEPASPAPTTPLEPPDQLISLRRAAKLGGLTAHTLHQQAMRNRLWAIRPGREYRTTRTALHRYLLSRGPQGRIAPLPPDYVAP